VCCSKLIQKNDPTTADNDRNKPIDMEGMVFFMFHFKLKNQLFIIDLVVVFYY